MDKIQRRVLGIDCGTAIVGWAISEKRDNKIVQIAYGDIRTPSGLDMSLRLKIIYESLLELIKQYQPTEVAVEDIFFFKNSKTVITVSQAKGVIMLAGAVNFLKVYNYTP